MLEKVLSIFRPKIFCLTVPKNFAGRNPLVFH